MAGNQKALGIAGLLFVIVIFVIMIQFDQGISVKDTPFIETEKLFPDGSTMKIYETPQFLTPEQEKILEDYAKEAFFFDTVTLDGIRESIRQEAQKLIESGIAPEEFEDKLREFAHQQESDTVTKAQLDEIVDDYESTVITKSGNITSYSLDINQTEIINDPVLKANYNPESTYKRGEIISIPIKITKSKSPPYVYNVIGTCCGMNSVFARSSVETDGQGNGLINIATNLKYPLGDYTVIISTLSEDNRSINRQEYHFRLIE